MILKYLTDKKDEKRIRLIVNINNKLFVEIIDNNDDNLSNFIELDYEEAKELYLDLKQHIKFLES